MHIKCFAHWTFLEALVGTGTDLNLSQSLGWILASSSSWASAYKWHPFPAELKHEWFELCFSRFQHWHLIQCICIIWKWCKCISDVITLFSGNAGVSGLPKSDANSWEGATCLCHLKCSRGDAQHHLEVAWTSSVWERFGTWGFGLGSVWELPLNWTGLSSKWLPRLLVRLLLQAKALFLILQELVALTSCLMCFFLSSPTSHASAI